MSRIFWIKASARIAALALVAACGTDAEYPLAPAGGRKPPATPPPNPEIAWSNDGLMVMNADGSNQVSIVPGGWVGNPTWAPAAPGASIRLTKTHTNRRIALVRVTPQDSV